MNIECGVCCEQFNEADRCPRLLGCGHTFCAPCLEKLTKSKSVACPTCRREQLVASGVASLPKNYALLDALAERKQKDPDEPKMCELCEEDEEEAHPATHRCLECEENMCAMMAKAHKRSKVSKSHSVVLLSEAKEGRSNVSVLCPEHGEPVKLYDVQCGQILCLLCSALSHKNHDCLSLAEAAKNGRNELKALAEKANAFLGKIKTAESNVANVRQELQQQETQVQQNIKSAFDEIRAVANAREKELLAAAAQQHKAKDFVLSSQQDQLRTVCGVLVSAVDRVDAVQGSTDAQVLVANADVGATLTALTSQLPTLEPEADSGVVFTADVKRATSLLSRLGEVSSRSTCAATTTAQGAGVERARFHEEAKFVILAKDEQGRARSAGGDIFVVESARAELKSFVVDNNNGTYNVSYIMAKQTKEHTLPLAVSLRGRSICGSPFAVVVSEMVEEAVIACGGNHTVVLMGDGTVRAFGNNGHGQLGDGSTTQRTLAIVVPNIANAKAVACGHNHTVVLMDDCTVRAFGNNGYGQLGDGSTTSRASAIVVPNIANAKAVACGYYHTVVLMDDGTVRAFGNNGNGQLGDGSTTRRTSAIVVPNIANAKAVACGNHHTVVLMDDGTVRAFGNNGNGQLGDCSTTNRTSAIVVSNIANAKAVACGYYHTVVLMGDGTVRAFGNNGNGELGDGSTTQRTSAIVVPNISRK